jgi:CheY-like chemotaxis protein
LPGVPEFTNVYYNMSNGDDAPRAPWNEGPGWDFVERPEPAVNVGDGLASSQQDVDVLSAMASRTASQPRQTRSPAPTLALGRMPGNEVRSPGATFICPVLSAIGVATALRRIEATEKVPLVAFTAFDTADHSREKSEVGFDAICRKPAELARLEGTIKLVSGTVAGDFDVARMRVAHLLTTVSAI